MLVLKMVIYFSKLTFLELRNRITESYELMTTGNNPCY